VNRGSEPVSPELALVDPALAEAARSDLPKNGAERAEERPATRLRPRADIARSATAPMTGQHSPASSAPSVPARPERERPVADRAEIMDADEQRAQATGRSHVAARARKRSRYGRRLAICALLAIGVWIAVSELGSGGGSEVRAPQPVVPRKAKSPTRHASPKHSSAPKAQPRTAPTGKASGRGRVRTFGWIPDPKASFYAIEFSRGPRKILEARATQPRLVVPATWTYRGRRFRFEPGGRYTWIVRPAFRSSGRVLYGAPIVRAKLVLPG
jgi:hypothetical protein